MGRGRRGAHDRISVFMKCAGREPSIGGDDAGQYEGVAVRARLGAHLRRGGPRFGGARRERERGRARL